MAFPWIFLLGKPPMSIILFATSLCILSCVIIVVVAWRIALILWYHRITTRTPSTLTATTHQSSLLNQGLDNKSLRSLPRVAYDTSVSLKLSECVICLMEFVDGDLMRVLPHCGHGFHVKCIDRWLKCHSSCPVCRHVLAIGRCRTFARV